MEKQDEKETKYEFLSFLRIRPQKNGSTELIDSYLYRGGKALQINSPDTSISFKNGRLGATFTFQDVFLPTTSQEEVFNSTTKPLLDGFLRGTSCLVLAYGVTGSGKTYTVFGPEQQPGLIPRTLSYILQGFQSPSFKEHFKEMEGELSLEMSFLEDYQNKVYDLLSPTPPNQVKSYLMTRTGPDGILRVKDLTEKKISTIQEGLDLINQGTREKHVAETNLNLDSSRSHTMFTINLIREHKGGREIVAMCRIVDLAGSERSSRTGVNGDRMKEAGQINNDLMNLMMVLKDMSTGVSVNPSRFRVCRLTYMLSTSMIGNLAGPVSMIINISNQKEDYDETFNVLDKTVFVKDIKTVKVRVDTTAPVARTDGGRRIPGLVTAANGVFQGYKFTAADGQRLQQSLQQAKQEIESLKEQHRVELANNSILVELRVREEVTEEIRRRDQDMGESGGYGAINKSMSQVISQLEERMQESMKLMREDFERREHGMKRQIEQLEGEVYYRDHIIETMQDDGKANEEIDRLREELRLLQESRTSKDSKLDEYEETIQALQKEKEEQAREMEEMRKRHTEEMEKLKQEKEEWENKYRKVVHTMSAKHGEEIRSSNTSIMHKSSGFGTMHSYGTMRSVGGSGNSPPPLPTTQPPSLQTPMRPLQPPSHLTPLPAPSLGRSGSQQSILRNQQQQMQQQHQPQPQPQPPQRPLQGVLSGKPALATSGPRYISSQSHLGTHPMMPSSLRNSPPPSSLSAQVMGSGLPRSNSTQRHGSPPPFTRSNSTQRQGSPPPFTRSNSTQRHGSPAPTSPVTTYRPLGVRQGSPQPGLGLASSFTQVPAPSTPVLSQNTPALGANGSYQNTPGRQLKIEIDSPNSRKHFDGYPQN